MTSFFFVCNVLDDFIRATDIKTDRHAYTMCEVQRCTCVEMVIIENPYVLVESFYRFHDSKLQLWYSERAG